MRIRFTVTLSRATSLGLALAVLLQAPLADMAAAQSVYRPFVETVLVSPEGDLLDYTPEHGSVVVSRDREGRRVLLDHYGNLVATEIPAETYFPRPRNARPGDAYGGVPDYRSYRGDGDDLTTGAVSMPERVERAPLDARPLPPADDGFANYGDNRQTGTLASIEQDRSLPEVTVTPQTPLTLNGKSRSEIAALQTLLDRAGASPGVIDGRMGSNVTKALEAYEMMTGERLDPNDSEDILQRLSFSGGMPIVNYTITPQDAAGPYVAAIPDDYGEKATMPALSYTSVEEALAERFHMDENYLRELNPGVDFTIPGSVIKVISPGERKTGAVTRIVADKGRKQVFAYDESGALVAAYPATIGSSDTPSPSGTHTVARIALDPGYTYNPKINFKQGDNHGILQIPPGPNGPVGNVWIALSKPTYGIHGTPEPSKIGKTNSHGCVRLTNWDATELAKMVKVGATVEFID
ncbi:L,D-transpeptidase [Rhizobiaceae bacterium BDR2-2]|uniref:L,D-transpeptidase n=1 Tax=Ectorhizobium quercum TaxID=2965071 RepID=A0AAE3MY96_9HYPH|nr:L,D-transpeptidase [Ectorhizobium quercum]MCX8996496.1 L,D-transpeptidase [Ectorhizobium quercum]